MATITVKKAAAGVQKFRRGRDLFAQRVLRDYLKELVRWIKRNKFRGGGRPGPTYVVNRSGRLSRSLKTFIERRGNRISGGVQMSGPQATTIEFGRKRSVTIVPKRKKMLRWVPEGQTPVFARRVVQKPSSFPPKRILASSIEKRASAMIRKFERELEREWLLSLER